MPIEEWHCQKCGTPLPIDGEMGFIVCKSCGAQYTNGVYTDPQKTIEESEKYGGHRNWYVFGNLFTFIGFVFQLIYLIPEAKAAAIPVIVCCLFAYYCKYRYWNGHADTTLKFFDLGLYPAMITFYGISVIYHNFLIH